PSAKRIVGHEPASLLGSAHAALVHPEDRAEVACTLLSLRTEEDDAQLRFRLRTREGAYLWVEGTARNMLDDPRVGAILINYRDVTDRIRLEEQLLQSRKLESIGRLAGGI